MSIENEWKEHEGFTILQKANAYFNMDDILLENIIHKYLVGDEVDDYMKAYVINTLGIDFAALNYCICTLKLNLSSNDFILNTNIMKKYYDFTGSLYAYIKNNEKYPVWIYKIYDNCPLIIFYSDSEMNEISDTISNIKNWILSEYHFETRWGVSSLCDNAENLWLCAHEALSSLNQSPNYFIGSSNETDSVYYPKQLEYLITRSMKTNDLKTLEFLLEIVKDENFHMRSMTKSTLATLNAYLINTLFKISHSAYSFDEQLINLNTIIIDYKGDYEVYFNCISQIFYQVCQLMNQHKIKQKSTLIHEITSYISLNYRDTDLSLTKIAQVFLLSEGYISSIFKEQTKTNFTDYIEDLRIKEACQLLIKHELSINEIADSVGYSNVYSFRRAFKRRLQVSPKDYRFSI